MRGAKAAWCAAWFLEHKIRVFPIKERDKVPACPSWDDYSATPVEVLRWTNYGVALGPFGVVDSDTPESEAWAVGALPPTPLVVTTGRGRHRYYRLIGAAPHFIHRGQLTIEFRNHGQYVVGPGSVHASGTIYTAADWSWQIQDVPFFPVADFLWDDRPDGERGSAAGQPLLVPPVIRAGERHDVLFKLMRSLQARGVEDLEQLLVTIRAANAEHCVPPINDGELVRYIRRVARYKDAPTFQRPETIDDVQLEPDVVAGQLIDIGVGPQTAIAAAKAIDPQFDPSGRTPAPRPPRRQRLAATVARLERQIADAKAAQPTPPSDASPLIEDEQGIGTVETIDDIKEIE